MKSNPCARQLLQCKGNGKKGLVLVVGVHLCICLSVLAMSCSEDKPTEPTTKLNPVSWNTDAVHLTADDFSIQADGKTYLANVSNIDVGGSSSTLELIWTEHDTDMRLFVYFEANSTDWWSDEVRTYDGAMNDGTRWIYYTGEFFKSSLGVPFQGDVDLVSSGSDNGITGQLHFKNLRLSVL